MSRWLVLISISTIVLAACSAAVVDVTPPEGGSTSASAAEPTASDSPPEDTAPAPTVAPTDTAPEEDTAPVDTGNPAADSAAGDDRCLPDGVRFRTSYWPQTDFCQYSIDFSEVLSGGPPPDGIPALDDPQFVSIADADAWLADVEPVISFEHEGDVRAYPLQILIWHEIVNDTVGGLPVSVTFCPLCNATIVFDRTVDGTVLDFGTSGNLRNSDLIMYDRQTQSWWQQFTGESIVGAYNGTRLTFLPAGIVSWADFKAEHPDGQVLSQDTGYGRSYGSNPYAGYDRIDSRPFLYAGELDGRLPPMARVAAIEVNPDTFVAFPFQTMEQVGVVNETIDGVDLVVFWKAGTTSSLDGASIAGSRDVGSTAIFNRAFEGQTLTFTAAGDGLFEDAETGTSWNIFGAAVDGPLAGGQLEQFVSHEYFWFSWAAFRPDTIIYGAN